MISRFFPGSRAELAAIDDEVMAAVSGPPKPGKAQSFEDQYISSGGQLYELMAGHDRFVADLRPLFERRRAGGAALCCHPYDLCTELIARELDLSEYTIKEHIASIFQALHVRNRTEAVICASRLMLLGSA